MRILVIGSVLFGMILGQFFKWYVLIPACGRSVVLVLVYPANMGKSPLAWFLQIYAVTTSVQAGYVIGLFGNCVMAGCNRNAAAAIATTAIFISISLSF